MDLEKARAVLLDHARHPRNVRMPGQTRGVAGVRMADSDVWTAEYRNPICGDCVRVFVRMADDRISECSLQVQGCTICMASASLMTGLVENRTATETDELRTTFQTAVGQPAGQEWPVALQELVAFEHLRVNPGRIPCSLIGWLALRDALSSFRAQD